jgi:predicted nucleic acid-binding protein
MILVDALTLYELGQVGELELFDAFEGDIVILDAVAAEVDVEPAATNLSRYCEEYEVGTTVDGLAEFEDDAMALLDVDDRTSAVALVAAMLAGRERDEDVALVSGDKRLRAIADGLGATVTSAFGVVVRATADDKYFSTTQAKRVIRRTDHHGVQMTGTLRERAIGEVSD